MEKLPLKQKNKSWLLTWWGILIAILFLPIVCIWAVWKKTKWSNGYKALATIAIIIFSFAILPSAQNDDQLNATSSVTTTSESKALSNQNTATTESPAITLQAEPPSTTTSTEPPTTTTTKAKKILELEITSVTSPINAGAYATLKAKTAPGAECDIEVIYKSGPSEAQGLYTKAAGSDGRVSWSWKVGTRTTPGDWSIYVTATANGETVNESTSFTVY